MLKKLLVTNKQFTQLINELKTRNIKLLIPKPSLFDPFFQFDDVKYTPLMEGILHTYKPEKIIGYLKKRYGDAAIVQLVDGENGEKVFMIKTGDVDSNQEVIDRDMALCGYFPSYVEKRNNERTIQYEPTYQNSVNNFVSQKDYIWHLTQTNKVKKILENGLCPKTNNKMFSYPNRVYFFLHKPEIRSCIGLMYQFYCENIRKVKGGEAKKIYTGPYTLLRIDTEQIRGIDFSYDPNAFECIYTYDNIKPGAIEVVCEIEQEYLKK